MQYSFQLQTCCDTRQSLLICRKVSDGPLHSYLLSIYFIAEVICSSDISYTDPCRHLLQHLNKFLSDSLWARIRRGRTNVSPRIQDPEENESVDSKTNAFYFILIWSCQVQGSRKGGVQSALYDHLVWCSNQV